MLLTLTMGLLLAHDSCFLETGLQTPCSSGGHRDWLSGLLDMPLPWLDVWYALIHHSWGDRRHGLSRHDMCSVNACICRCQDWMDDCAEPLK